jgi:hypothetical protein
MLLNATRSRYVMSLSAAIVQLLLIVIPIPLLAWINRQRDGDERE